MQHPGRDQNMRARRYWDVVGEVVLDRLTHDHKCRRIQPKDFIHHRAGANELRRGVGRGLGPKVDRPSFGGEGLLLVRHRSQQV